MKDAAHNVGRVDLELHRSRIGLVRRQRNGQRLDDRLRALLASALSICGVSAAVAAAGAVEAKKEQLAYTATLVIVFAVPSIFLLPWLANLMGWIRAVRASGVAADIIVALPHIGTHEGTNNKYQEYSRLARPLADTYGFALVNWWTLGGNSWTNWTTTA